MAQFFSMFAWFWGQIIGLFDTVILEADGIQASLTDILFALLVVGFVITVFWRGART